MSYSFCPAFAFGHFSLCLWTFPQIGYSLINISIILQNKITFLIDSKCSIQYLRLYPTVTTGETVCIED